MVIFQEWISVRPLFNDICFCVNIFYFVEKYCISAQFGTQSSPMTVGEPAASASMVAIIPAVIVITQDIFCHINGKTA